MSRESIRRALVLLLVLPLLGGCFVTSENPILRPGEDGRDPALRGLWVTKEGREFLHVMRPDVEGEEEEPPGFSGLYVISEGEETDDRDGWVRVRMITTTVKNRNLISMRFSNGESNGDLAAMPGWLIFAYEVRDGQFHLHMIEEDLINEALKAGELPGKPRAEKYGDPHVTASAEEWIAYLEEADLSAMFDDDEDSYLRRLSEDMVRAMLETPEEAGTQAGP